MLIGKGHPGLADHTQAMTGGFPLLDWLLTAFTPFIYSIHSFIPLIVCYRAFHIHDTFVLYCCFTVRDTVAACCCLFNLGLLSFPPAGVAGGRYLYTTDLLKLGAFCQADVNPSWAKAPIPINQSHLASLLCHHPDRCFVLWLLRGLDEGFPISLIQPGVTYCQWHTIILPHSVIGRWLPST